MGSAKRAILTIIRTRLHVPEASTMIKSGIPFDASIRFNKAGDLR